MPTQKLPKGVPTAEQEALQQPTVDPVTLAAGAGTAGLFGALNSLSDSAGMDSVLAARGMGGVSPSYRVMDALRRGGMGLLNQGRMGLFRQLFGQAMGQNPRWAQAASLPAGPVPQDLQTALDMARKSAGEIEKVPGE